MKLTMKEKEQNKSRQKSSRHRRHIGFLHGRRARLLFDQQLWLVSSTSPVACASIQNGGKQEKVYGSICG